MGYSPKTKYNNTNNNYNNIDSTVLKALELYIADPISIHSMVFGHLNKEQKNRP